MAQRWGLTSVLALPLNAAGSTVGAVNLGCTTTVALDEEQVRAARALASQGAALLSGAIELEGVRTELVNLRAAMDSRAVIEQAKGVLMARDALGAESAFAVLRSRSQRENRKVREIAAELVTSAENNRQL